MTTHPGLAELRRDLARTGVILLVLLIALGIVLVAPGGADAAPTTVDRRALTAGNQAAQRAAQADVAPDGSFSATKKIERAFASGGGRTVVDERTVTVNANQTRELRGRERIRLTWSGAHPSGGRAANPYGETGMAQEYPVVIMQCRGLDDPSLPAAKQVAPETCWTSTRLQRTQSVADRVAVWRHDLYADEADRAQKSGLDPFPAEECNDIASLSTHITPFVAADGDVYRGCSSDTMPPEAAVGASYPAAEVAAFTDKSGNGNASFEIRTAIENESLGCSTTVACSIVVIPIMGISCIDNDRECRRSGQFDAGSSNFNNQGVDASVSPALWWSESNWRNRFSIPLTFALPPNTCDVLDPRPAVGFYGSELMSQATSQWAPAYCLDQDRFKFQHGRMSDAAGFRLMEEGSAVGALVSGEHELRGTDKVGYAPTAVTGFAISYVVDRPDNAGEYTTLRLNARLLAKLLTQSYTGSDLGRQHPGMGENPLSINQDPEFQRLNPGLDSIAREAGATLLSLSESSDVITTLTSYINEDAAARAFIAGQADQWGMVVNPSYKGIGLPISEWPLRDTFIPTSQQECLQQNRSVYFNQLAAPVTSMRTIAEAVLDAWPNVQTKCDRSVSTDPWKLGRIDRQGLGTRFMFGVVSLGDAARFGLRTAALQTKGTTYVGPTDAGLTRAITLATQERDGQPFVLDQGKLRADGRAYPGTMVVYTAARLTGMAKADAATVASFIRIATTEGQQSGRGNGQLPAGYLPIRKQGATRKLFLAARGVADAVEAQKAPVEPTDDPSDDPTDDPSGDPSGDPTGPGNGSSDPLPPASPPSAPAPSASTSTSASPAPSSPVVAEPVATAATSVDESPIGQRLLLLLIIVGIVGTLASGGSRVYLYLRRFS